MSSLANSDFFFWKSIVSMREEPKTGGAKGSSYRTSENDENESENESEDEDEN